MFFYSTKDFKRNMNGKMKENSSNEELDSSDLKDWLKIGMFKKFQ